MLRKSLGLAGLIFSMLACASISARAEKHALLIGINDYKFYGPTNVPAGQNLPPFDLFGCVNDVKETKKFLRSQGFSEGNITVILDQQASKANMIAAMEGAAKKVKAGDVFYFHFSGHGFQMSAADQSSEDDAQDELLACADYSGDPFAAGNAAGDAGCIRDDYIAKWIASFQTSKKLFIFDCCHSGTVSRNLMRLRRLPTVKVPRGKSRGLTVAARSFGDGIRKQTPSRTVGSNPDFVVLSACKDDQTAADTGQFGAFSYNLLEAYKKAAAGDPLTEVLNSASRGIASKGMSQEPQPALGGKYQTDPAKATLRNLFLEEGAGASPAAPPVQVQPSPPLPLDVLNTEKITVSVLGFDQATAQTIAAGINALEHAQVVQGTANRSISRDASGRALLTTADGVKILDLESMDGSKILQAVNPYLIQAYLMRKLAVLDNSKSKFNVSVQLLKNRTLVLEGAPPGVDPTVEDPLRPTILIGDPVFFNVTVDRPAFITLINIGTDGSTTVLFPNQHLPESVQAVPGQVYQFPPPGFKLSDGRDGIIKVTGPVGTEMVLVLATSKKIDLSQFPSQQIFGGARSLGARSAVSLAAKSKNLVLDAAGSDEGGWGSAIVLATVREKSQ